MSTLSEFNVINQYFKPSAISHSGVIQGIGDDAAVLTIPVDKQLVISVDTLVADVHFFADADPFDIGYKSLAVNLSDLAAMGAQPAWATLSLTLPEINEHWLTKFSQGFFSLLEQYQMQLIGGDTTRGPLSITVQVHGFVPNGSVLLRSGAKVGDKIFVTGTLGDAAAALHLLKVNKKPMADTLLQRLYQPTPRIEVGQLLRDIASSAIDISDGLVADLRHILNASQVGANLYIDKLPLSKELLAIPTLLLGLQPNLQMAWDYALSGGDDYELCFTVPAKKIPDFLAVTWQSDCLCTEIGEITDSKDLRLIHADGAIYQLKQEGYQHFR